MWLWGSRSWPLTFGTTQSTPWRLVGSGDKMPSSTCVDKGGGKGLGGET